MNNSELPDFVQEVNSPQLPAVVQDSQMVVSQDYDHALANFERREALFKKVLQVAISATTPKDWVNQDGKPYLQSSGAERVAMRFGVVISDINQVKEDYTDAKGTYYVIKTTGRASFGQGEITAIVTCSSRDKFFGRARGELKALEDVDMANIMKKSYTNFTVNAITRLLGIRNLTWEELAKYGIRQEGSNQVSYKKQGAVATPPHTQTQSTPQSDAKKPYWKWTANDGSEWISAQVGSHFGAPFLESLGMRAGKKEGMYNGKFNPVMLSALEKEYDDAEQIIKAGGAQ